MKIRILPLLIIGLTPLMATAPISSRPDTPPVPLNRIIEIAALEAAKVDPLAYAGGAKYCYGFMSPSPDEFTSNRWEVVFYHPNSPVADSRYPEIIITVTLDGKKTAVRKNEIKEKL